MSHEKKYPSKTVSIVIEYPDREPQWFNVGALWENDKGVLSGDTVYGRMVVQDYKLPTDNH